jgi:hypothetical protein
MMKQVIEIVYKILLLSQLIDNYNNWSSIRLLCLQKGAVPVSCLWNRAPEYGKGLIYDHFFEKHSSYTGSLALADFIGSVFTCDHFQQIH